MTGHLLVSISSIFDETLKDAAKLVSRLDEENIPVSLLVAPHIDGNWHLAKDKETLAWLTEQREAGRTMILNGFDQAAKGRRSEFATLGEHEARLRLKGSTRQMKKLGFELDIFAPPRWRLSEGTLAVLPEFGFTIAASTKGLYNLESGDFLAARNLSVGEGFGAARWWRRNIIRAAERGAEKGNSIRLSVSARNLGEKKVARDFAAAAVSAANNGAIPSHYHLLHR